MINVSQYIGKPYKPNCRDGSGYDCYTLMLAIQRDMGLSPVDLFYEATKPETRLDGIKKELPKYERLVSAQEGCVVVMYTEGIPQHVGIYLGKGLVVHATEERGVVIDDISLLKTEGVYKLK